MLREAEKSVYNEIAFQLHSSLKAECFDSDFFYEIVDMKQTYDAYTLPMRCSIQAELTLSSAENSDNYLVCLINVENVEATEDDYYLDDSEVSLFEVYGNYEEIEERIIAAFRSSIFTLSSWITRQ